MRSCLQYFKTLLNLVDLINTNIKLHPKTQNTNSLHLHMKQVSHFDRCEKAVRQKSISIHYFLERGDYLWTKTEAVSSIRQGINKKFAGNFTFNGEIWVVSPKRINRRNDFFLYELTRRLYNLYRYARNLENPKQYWKKKRQIWRTSHSWLHF